MSKSIRGNNQGGDIDSNEMFAQVSKDDSNAPKIEQSKGGKPNIDSNTMFIEAQKKKPSTTGGGNQSNENSQSKSDSTTAFSQQEINDAFGAGLNKPEPTIDNLDSVEKKQLNAATPIPLNPASNQQVINNLIQKRQDPVQKIKNATDFIESDYENNKDAVKDMPIKEVLSGGDKVNAASYTLRRIQELKETKAHILGNLGNVSSADLTFNMTPDVTQSESIQQQIANNNKLQRQASEIDQHINELTKYGNILNLNQAVTSTPLPKNRTQDEMAKHYRDIGVKVGSIDYPIETEHKSENIKNGIDAKRNQELVQIEDYRKTSQGLDASEENLKARFGLGSVSEYEYKAGMKDIADTRNNLYSIYPKAKEAAVNQALGQVLSQNRNSKEKWYDELNMDGGIFHNLIHTGYSDEEISQAGKQMGLSTDEVKNAINNKDDIAGTSFFGTLVNSTINHTAEDIQSIWRTPEKTESDKYESDKSFQLNPDQQLVQPETIKDVTPTIKDSQGNTIPNPNYLKDVNNPNAGNHNWVYGSLNTLANATGSLAGLWLTTETTGALGDAALGGVIGADAIGVRNTAKGLQEVTKFTTEQKNLFGNVVGMTLTNFAQNKEISKEFIGKEQGGENAQNVYAITRGLETGLLFGLGFAPQKLIGKVLGAEEKVAAKSFADLIPEKGIEYLDKNKWTEYLKNNLVAKIAKDGLKSNIEATTMMAIDQAAQVGTQAMFNPQSVQSKNIGSDLMSEGVKNFLTFAPISFLGAGVGVLHNPHDNQSMVEQEAIYRIGKDPVTYKNYVDNQVKDATISQEDANKRIHLVNQMAEIHNSGIVNENLSRSEKIEYANNTLHANLLEKQIEKIKSVSPNDRQIEIKQRQIESLQERRSEILNNSDGVDKDANGKPLTPTYKIGDKSVTKEIFLHALKQSDAADILSKAEVSGDEKIQAKLRELGGTTESDYKTATGVIKEDQSEQQQPLSFVGKQDDVLVKDRTFFNENEEKEYHDLISDDKKDDADLMIEQRKKELIEQSKNTTQGQDTEPHVYDIHGNAQEKPVYEYDEHRNAQENNSSLNKTENEKAKETREGNKDVVSKEEPSEPVSEVGSSTTKEKLISDDYRIQHRIVADESNATLDDMTKGGELVPEDFYTHPHYYADISKKSVKESIKFINEAKGNPEKEVTVYRSVPKGVDKINEGDWISLSKSYAKEHGEKEENSSVISMKVKAKDVSWDGNDVNEFAYFPKEEQALESNKPIAENLKGEIVPVKEAVQINDKEQPNTAADDLQGSYDRLIEEGNSPNDEEMKSMKQRIEDLKSGKDKEPPKPPTEEPLNLEGKSPEKQWTAIRKAKLEEVDKVKDLFKAPERKKWSGVIESAMKNLQDKYPDKNLYDASRLRVNEFATLYDNKVPFNPTTEDLAVMQYFKADTEKRINDIQGWDSTDDLQRMSAMAQFESLNNDLLTVSKAINPSEAGRAFGFRQSETRLDPEFGLQVRRMELMDAKNGEKLSDEDLKFTAEQWDKELELRDREHELKTKSMQESFDKEIERSKKEYDEKLKKLGKPITKELALTTEKRKSVAESIRKAADKFEKAGKAKGTEGAQGAGVDIQKMVADGMRYVADKVEEGKLKLPDIIADAIAKYGAGNEDELRKNITDELINSGIDKTLLQHEKDNVLDKIKEHAELNKVQGITAEMVGKNLIRDYVNSHIGDVDTKDILNTATEGLKEVFPDIAKEKLTEAYLKRGEFEQPTKKKLENDFKESQSKLVKLAKIEKDLSDFKEKKNLYTEKTPESKIRETDKDILAKEKELKQALNDAGVKTSNEDKYAKASYESRAQSHNQRIDDLSNKIKEKIEEGKLSDEAKNNLTKLNNQLEASRVKLDGNSKFSHAPVLDNGLSVLKKVKSEFDRNIKIGNVSELGEVKRGLQNIIDKFGSDKDESEQNIKLQRTKDNYKNKISEFQRKMNAGEFEDKPIVTLNKADAELVRLERDKLNISQRYNQKRQEYERQNKSGVKRTFEFLRSAYTDWLIGSPITLAKVAFSAALRPNVEAVTKKVGGTIFNKMFPELSQRAKLGGESNRVGEAYKAYLGQYDVKIKGKSITTTLEEKYTKANDQYEKSNKAYNEFKGEVEKMDKRTSDYADAQKKLEKLDNKQKKDLVNAVGNSIYSFIAGSSIKESLLVLQNRTATIETMFGQFEKEELKSLKDNPAKFETVLDNMNYVMNYIGRSHAALKTLSGRFSFAAGFISRLEGAVNDGVDVTKPDKILEIANESYMDWDRGKYQQSNLISDGWNKVVKAVDEVSPQAAYIMRSDVAVTRVPVNILHEAVMEYTLGAITSTFNIGKEYYKASKNIDLKVDLSDKDKNDFRSQLREGLSKVDSEKAAAIARSFRKGGFGLGMYALGALGVIQFGGFGHKGQTKDDKKTKKIEDETGVHQVMTGEIDINGKPINENIAKIVEHGSQLYPLFLGLGLYTVYNNNIKQGKSSSMAAANDGLQHINTILSSIPQIQKVLLPMATDVYQSVVPKVGSWDDVDMDGNPIKRKAFEMKDYLNILPGYGNKKEVLSDDYYKQALSTKRDYESQKSDIENDANLSDEEKKKQKEDLDVQENNDIEQIYKDNKENPQ